MDRRNIAGIASIDYAKSTVMDKKVVVIGGGESGVGAAVLAIQKGYEVFLTDAGSISDKYKNELNKNQVPFEEKGHTIEKLSDANLVVKSPGVPDSATIVEYYANSNVEVISEIEFGYLHYTGKVLAITGSNGKTTASGLLYHLMHTANYDVAFGGNYGISFCRLITDRQPDFMVLEISSFQLDNCHAFKPNVAAILNITPDHLDRYEYDMSLYAAAKMKISHSQNEEDFLIINEDDQTTQSNLHMINDEVNLIGIGSEEYINGVTSKEGDTFTLTIKGIHNRFNARVAVEMARIVGVGEDQIAQGLSTFKNEAHRLETVAVIDGVEYINDSKATNVDATYYALEAMEGDIIWIAGGTDKGNDYETLLPLVKEKVKALICLGKDNEKLKNYFLPHIELILETTKVSKVLKLAQEIAVSGNQVLLSPACASFDLFKNYIDRGDQYKAAIKELSTINIKNEKD